MLPPVDRSVKGKKLTPSIKGMKTTYFSFLTVRDDTIAARRFSCNCAPCQAAGELRYKIGRQCENYDTCGPWDLFEMTDDGVFMTRAHELLREECDRDDSWPTRWHDVCGLEGAECARDRTDPGDILLKCTYCPGAFHLDCVGMSHRKRFQGDWACPACIETVRTSVSSDPPRELEQQVAAQDTTPASPMCKKGWLVAFTNPDYPENSEYEFHLDYVCCNERVSTVQDVDQNRSDRVGQHIVQTITCTRVSETVFELVDLEPSWFRAKDVCCVNVQHRLTSRKPRRVTSVSEQPKQYRQPPKHVYMTSDTSDHIIDLIV